jgi:tripartite-type tricarboxylate transporter receptor subunit TctC
MKKLLLALLFAVSNIVYAQPSIDVEVLWPYSLGVDRVNWTRLMLDKANASQTKYNFVLMQAQGAAGVVAARKTLNAGRPTLMLTTTAFFLKPITDPDNSYAINAFKPMVLMAEVPLAIGYNTQVNPTLESLIKKPQINFAIGSGLGGTFHALSEQFKFKHPNTIIIPFNASPETVTQVKGGHLDLFIEEIRGITMHPEMAIVGITGSKRQGGFKTLIEQGYPNTDKLNNINIIVGPTTMNPDLFKELQDILLTARSNTPRINESIVEHFGTPLSPIKPSDYDKWMTSQEKFYRELMKNLKF